MTTEPTSTLKLASKEEILAKVAANDYNFFDEDSDADNHYWQGKSYDNTLEWGTPEYIAHRQRRAANALLPVELADKALKASVVMVEDDNDGDGNEMRKTIHFKDYDLYVSLRGYYSSWDNSQWENVYVTRPVEYTAVRFVQV